MWLFADQQQATVLLKSGLVALQHGELSRARGDLEEAEKIDPQNAYVWSSLAETYLRLHLPGQASGAAAKAEKLGGEDPLICHALAMYYSGAAQPGRAAVFEEKFAESSKADAGALGRAASLYLSAGEAEQAVRVAEKAVARANSAENEDLLGRALSAVGRADEAQQHLQWAWERAKADPQIAFDYAQALLTREDFTDAAAVIESGLAEHSRDPQLRLALGVARYGQRRFEDAIVAFLAVIDADPSIEQPYVFLGRVLDQAGPHLAQITAAYERWVASDPKSATAHLLLAEALLVADPQSARAETLLRRAIALNANGWEAHYQLGVMLASKHEYEAAAAELTRSVALDPKQPLPHYHLARVYDRLGEPEKAKAEREIHLQLSAPNRQHEAR